VAVVKWCFFLLSFLRVGSGAVEVVGDVPGADGLGWPGGAAGVRRDTGNSTWADQHR
jgi:hypothetical protein